MSAFTVSSSRGLRVFAAILAVIAAAFLAGASSVSAATNPLDNPNPLCRYDAGCMSKAMCDKRSGELATCPELGEECAQPGWGLCYPAPTAIPLKIAIGGKTSVFDIGEYIATAYTWAVGAAAVVAAVMLMVGGLQYLTSGGGGAVSAAKARIKNALVGLGITVFAYLILATVNPALITLVVPRIPMVPPKSFAECQDYQLLYQCGAPFGLKQKAGSSDASSVADRYETVAIDDPSSVATCLGLSCSLAGSWDGTHKCVRRGSGNPPEVIPKGVPVPPYECVGCSQNGTSCSGLGPNDACCGGFCGNSESAIGRVGGQAVDIARQISSGVNSVAGAVGIGGSCSNGANGIGCAVDEECYGGHCVNVIGTGGVCSSGVAGAICNGDDTCNSGLICTDSTYGTGRCVQPGAGTLCFDDGDCRGMSCAGFGVPASEEGSFGRAAEDIADDVDAAGAAFGVLTGGVGGIVSYGIREATESAIEEKIAQNLFFQMCGGVREEELCDRDSDCGTGRICWRNLPSSFEDVVGDTGKGLCKSVAPGTFCKEDYDCRIPGGDQTAYCCVDCLSHMQVFGSFGICTLPVGGAGCDEDSDCQRSDDPAMDRAICHDTDGYKLCTYPGIQGAPCVAKGGRDSCVKDAAGNQLICATKEKSGVDVGRCMPPNPNR